MAHNQSEGQKWEVRGSQRGKTQTENWIDLSLFGKIGSLTFMLFYILSGTNAYIISVLQCTESSEKIQLSSVIHVPSGLMGYASAA